MWIGLYHQLPLRESVALMEQPAWIRRRLMVLIPRTVLTSCRKVTSLSLLAWMDALSSNHDVSSIESRWSSFAAKSFDLKTRRTWIIVWNSSMSRCKFCTMKFRDCSIDLSEWSRIFFLSGQLEGLTLTEARLRFSLIRTVLQPQ